MTAGTKPPRMKLKKYSEAQLRTVHELIEKPTNEIANYMGLADMDVLAIKVRLMRLDRIKVVKSSYVKLEWAKKKGHWWQRK